MPKLTTEQFGSGDQSWLGSTHGISNARTVNLDPTLFTEADHYPNGYIRSGQPLTITNNVARPYAGEGEFHGFLLTDQKTDGETNIGVPLFDHGRVRVGRLPVSFTAPEAGNDKTTIVFE